MSKTVTDEEPRPLEHERLPINIWGDVLLNGEPPQIRRVLCGMDAHECLLAWVYLNEMLSLNEMVSATRREDAAQLVSTADSMSDAFAHLKAATPDPQYQITEDILAIFLPAVLFVKAAGEANTEFCELGCTYFSAIEKLEICSFLSGAALRRQDVLFTGIDHSSFMLRASAFCHPNSNLQLCKDFKDWAPAREHVFHLSRFVASYAVAATVEFADWMKQFDAFTTTDVFNLEARDFATSNNGLPQVFLNLPAFIDSMAAEGWRLFLTDVHPDYNSQRKCLVARIFGIREDVAEATGYFERVASSDYTAQLLAERPLTSGAGDGLLAEVETQLSAEEWAALAEYKKFFPIWGRPFPPVSTVEDARELVTGPACNLNLHFAGGQIESLVRQALERQGKA